MHLISFHLHSDDICHHLAVVQGTQQLVVSQVEYEQTLESQANAKSDAKKSLKTATEASMPEVSSSKTIAKMVKEQVAATRVGVASQHKSRKDKAAKHFACPYMPLPAKAACTKAQRAGKAVAGRKKKTKSSSTKASKGKNKA
ncbi:hypothetical protein H2248_008260 [Termitomyces sp. 'cryptogamus']|nr:hypothetical protein H2248_008260 [Termitomyces sp. 'cryptogamus']